MLASTFKMLVLALTVIDLLYGYTLADGGQFYGGSMSYSIEQKADGNYTVTVHLISGWVLGKGPCGPGCSSSDIGRSTRSARSLITASHPYRFGNFTSDYLDRNTRKTITQDMSAVVYRSYNETVIAVSEHGKWEQELLHFSFNMPHKVRRLDVSFDGKSWKNLTLQNPSDDESIPWHMQTSISLALRSDTGKPNQTPRSIVKPFYRVKLGEVTEIRIPAVDVDEDIVRCDTAVFVEAGFLRFHPPPNVHIHENCSVFINASESSNYTHDTWIAVQVTMRDYNREKITYLGDTYPPALFSLSASAVRFAVQVLANLTTPKFVDPTFEGKHVFIMYSGTTLRTEIYARSAANTIDSLRVIGIQYETFNVSVLKQDVMRSDVKHATLSWKPSRSDSGSHIACVNAIDNTGVETSDQRCFILDVRGEGFKHTTKVTAGKPYFVDIPAPDQYISCKIQTTCFIALYIKSAIRVTKVEVTESFVDYHQLSPVELVIHEGEQMYQTDLSFGHAMNGKERICLIASDISGVNSEEVCIQTEIEPRDPCVSAPCYNSGDCVSDKDSGAFKCVCLPYFSGKTCSIKNDLCNPDPCVHENTISCFDIGRRAFCYCKPGFSGRTCAQNIDDCPVGACNGHGICIDKIQDFDCECFDRFNGTVCEYDMCSKEQAGVMTCPAAGCHPDSCYGRGVCSDGGICSCPYGFNGRQCEKRKCIITTSKGVEIVSPSVKDRGLIVCYTDGDEILFCQIRIYLTMPSVLVPKIEVNSTWMSNGSVTVGKVMKSPVIPGVSSIYTTDIDITGRINSSKLHYVCVRASSAGISNSSVCYEISFVPNPENDTSTLAYSQRKASVKFVAPTLKDRSRILCNVGEKCHILMYTSFSSNRSACRSHITKPATASHGLSGCDLDDRDNDEDDNDTVAKLRDPCCENILSSTAGVEVYKSRPRGPSCVTEASFKFSSPGERQMCFLSADTDSQQLCYTVGVYDHSKDPCSNSPCLNNGQCFNTNHTSFKCICPDQYTGEKCQRGPCQAADNKCLNDAYCQTNDGTEMCICKAGFFGQTCSKGPSSVNQSYTKFTDTVVPTSFTCVIYQKCSVALILTSQSAYIPIVSPGYIDTSLSLERIETVNRLPVIGSFQTNTVVKPLELGLKDMCIQTKDIIGLNEDEICIKVNVISDVISIYGFKDRPHFVEPSLPTNAEVECVAGGPCHILYQATAGIGNEHECVTFQLSPPVGFVNYHLFSSCDNCKPGNPGSGNCTVDVSLVTKLGEIGVNNQFCISAEIEGLELEGEKRCFNLTITDPSSSGKKGCQIIKCRNGGFCDGHLPSDPICFCTEQFSGKTCEQAEAGTELSSLQKQSFIGNSAVPSLIECGIKQDCHIPFQILSKQGLMPRVHLGFKDPGILISKPSVKALGDSTGLFEGFAVCHSNKRGNFRACFQLNLNSNIEDDLCVKIHTSTVVGGETKMTKPYFTSPSLPTGSTVLCQVNKTCHFYMHFTKGDAFGSPNKCPSMWQAGLNTLPRVHIFEPELHATDCTADVSYIPSSTKDKRKLCLQVALPGRKGEIRCYLIRNVLHIRQEVLSPCRGKTCSNGGNCIADLDSNPYNISCVCQFGNSGNICNTGNSCNKTCLNNGTCVNGECHCQLGFNGEHCERVMDPCSSSPCVRGTCFHHSTQYHCLCPSGYTGKKCELNINECQSQPCLNGGVCVDNIGDFKCNCSSGFVGNTCEIDVNECISQPCLNGGFCKDSIDRFLCQCRTGFDGDRCQNVVDPCISNPCIRGICFSHGSQFLCECPSGFTGKLCETTIQLTLNGPKETYLKVPAGSEIMMNCSVSGLHPPKFHWSKLNACGDKYENIKASVYREPHASLEDDGTYVCTGSDGYGPNVTSYFHVEIISLQKNEVCNFDDGTLCGWEQEKSDIFDWTFQSGPTQSDGTGPDVDHTLGTLQGKYVYIESSSPRIFGEHASLLSHVMPANRTMCFEFWYYMFGDGSGRLFVLVQDTCLKKETQLFEETGDKGAQWNKASVTITDHSVPNDYIIVLKADVGSTFHGDTAVDDLVIYEGSCQGSHGAPIVG
ncbi:uncharacterized protein LOC123541967 isoform X2 [Mercenaria mercenaria]|uniref:uncharacterized protein LOC123541967 isoform X2 n=1 Tax=Mercenaria mercenaria TaxID=6596 RepID=UPI00234F91E3|nr:uncharacterized protein LOC123541967 isoform X2 [Mercenaria mercenaria]